MSDIIGIFQEPLTNTPALGAAQQTLKQMGSGAVKVAP